MENECEVYLKKNIERLKKEKLCSISCGRSGILKSIVSAIHKSISTRKVANKNEFIIIRVKDMFRYFVFLDKIQDFTHES